MFDVGSPSDQHRCGGPLPAVPRVGTALGYSALLRYLLAAIRWVRQHQYVYSA